MQPGASSTETVSVVICAYSHDRWEALLDAVDSVRRQRRPADEIIVVVDHNPSLLERVRAHLPDVLALANSGVRGLSGARNSGVAAARGQILVFLDEDAVAEPEWLDALIAPYRSAYVLGVGGAIEPIWLDGRPAWFPAEFGWVVGCSYRGLPETTTPVRNLIGCNMSFRREVFDAVGGFRDGIGRVGTQPDGCEETELCIRISQHSPGDLLYEPRARVRHRVPAQRASWRYFVARCYAEGHSKARVTRLVGSRDGLASERNYTLRTLPGGVLNGLRLTLDRGDPTGLGRASAILVGLTVTTAGYLLGRARVAA